MRGFVDGKTSTLRERLIKIRYKDIDKETSSILINYPDYWNDSF